MDKKLSQPEWIIVIAGAVALLGSFLPWLDIDTGFGSVTRSAWSDGFFPTYTWVGIFGAVMAAVILLRVFANVSLPANVLGFTWTQIHLILGVFAALLALSFLIAGEEFGIGFWISLIAAIALVVGAWMYRSQSSATTL